MEDIKKLMTEHELSQYEKLETASNALRNICNYEKRTVGYAASELQGSILKEMKSIRDNILIGRRLCYDYGSETYFTNSSYDTLFTGWAFAQNEDFIPDDGKAEHICYFKDGKLSTSGIPRNVSQYIFDNTWYCIMEHGLNNILFNLGCENPVVILLDTCNVSFKIQNPIHQLSYFLDYFDEVCPLGYRNEIIPMQAKQWEKGMRE